jgi:PAS domain S-box-containing protein
MRSIRDGEEVRDEDIVHLPAEGSQFTLRYNSSPIRDEEEGCIVAAVAVIEDITERKWAEEKLSCHGHLLENMQDAVLGTDEQFVLTVWNKGTQEMFGWTADEALGRDIRDLIPRDYSDEQLAEELLELTETGRWRGERVWYRKDGTPVHAECLTIALRGEPEGQITGYLGIMRDVSERKRAEEALGEANRRTENILESITDAFVAVDREWRYTYINERALGRIRRAKSEGITREDLLGKTFLGSVPGGRGHDDLPQVPRSPA